MQSPLPFAALLFNAFVWGLAWWPFQRMHQAGLHPLWATASMYAVVLVALLAWRPGILAQVRAHPQLWLLALASGLNNVAFNWAVTIGDVVRVILLFYLMPAWAVLLAWRILGERPTPSALLRLALAFAGVVRYSQLHDSPNNIPANAPRVLVVDTIGLLSAIYRYGQIAYIGGGFGVGIHNTLEAAVYGMPVLFGPNHKRFNEALGLIAAGGATGIANANELKHSLDALLANHNKLEQRAKAAANYVQSMSGATTAIMQALKTHL